MTAQPSTFDHTLDGPLAEASVDQTLALIGPSALMMLGAHNLSALPHPRAGVVFSAKLLPFTKAGSRSSAPRIMTATVERKDDGLYSVRVEWERYSRAAASYGRGERVVHFEADGVEPERLSRLMGSLDYDGESMVTNPDFEGVVGLTRRMATTYAEQAAQYRTWAAGFPEGSHGRVLNVAESEKYKRLAARFGADM